MIRKILKVTGLVLAVGAVSLTVVYLISRQHMLDRLTASSHIVETTHGPIQYSLSGDAGPVMLFAHGTPGGFNNSPFFSSRGLEAYRLLTPSRSGYMATPLEAGRSPQAQAQAYLALIDALEIDKVIVLAVSGGGPSALAFAQTYPERTEALVALEALSQPYQEPLYIPLVMKSDFLFWMGVGIMTSLGDGLGIFADEDAQRIRNSPDGLERVRNWLWASWPVSQRLAGWRNDSDQFMSFALQPERIRAPTLILNGTADEAAHHADAERLARAIPDARLYAIEGATHAMLITHKDELNKVINEFLQEKLAVVAPDRMPVTARAKSPGGDQ